jgi:hypothetical protein
MHVSFALAREAQGENRPGGNSADQNDIAMGFELIMRGFDSRVPVFPRGETRNVRPCGQTRKQRTINRVARAPKAMGDKPQLGGSAAETMNEKDSGLPAESYEAAAIRIAFPHAGPLRVT